MGEKDISCVISVVLAACLCSLSFCQNPGDFTFQLLETTLEKIDAFTHRLEEVFTELETIKDSQAAQEQKVEDLLTKMNTLEGQMTELHGSTAPDSQLQIFVDVLKMEKNLCATMVNGTWRTEVAELRESLDSSWRTEVDELRESLDSSWRTEVTELRESLDSSWRREVSALQQSLSENIIYQFKCFTNNNIPYGSSCYIFNNDKKTWSEARQQCQAMRGDLAKVYNEGILEAFRDKVDKYYWIGLSDTEKEGTYVWSVDKEVHNPDDYQHWWNKGEPNDHEGIEDCIQFRSDMRLNDNTCSKEMGYICEVKLSEP